MTITNAIRDIREAKQLSQDKVAEAAGLTYSKFVRIEEGSGKTTQEEIDAVLTALDGLEAGTRKLAGRPFGDAAKQAAVAAARETGLSVAAVLSGEPAMKPAPKKATPKKAADATVTDIQKALAKKAPAPRVRKPRAPKTDAE